MDIIKILYSIEPRDRKYVKGYGFLSFAKSIGKNISNKYSQKPIDIAKRSATDTIKTASKGATGDFTCNKIGDKITSVSMELHSKKSKELRSKEAKIYISTRKTTNY